MDKEDDNKDKERGMREEVERKKREEKEGKRQK